LKILVISDSHNFKKYIFEAIESETPDMILHLGDNMKDCEDLDALYPQIPLRGVKGNCDTFVKGLDIDEFTLEGKRFMMTHGHLFGVKSGKDRILKSAIDRSVDVLLYGHTHIPYHAILDRLTAVNPGSLGGADKSYAVLEIKNGDVFCQLKNLYY